MIPALLAACLLAAAPQAPAAPAADPVERRRDEVARELVRVGQELRRELVAGDARALGARVPGVVTPSAPLCFERRDERWWFTESLYPCG